MGVPPPGGTTFTVAVTEPGCPLTDGETAEVSVVTVTSGSISWLSGADVSAR